MRSLRVAFFLLLLTPAMVLCQSRNSAIIGEAPPAPASLEALWKASPIVILGTFDRGKDRLGKSPQNRSTPMREFSVTIREVYKDDGTIGLKHQVQLTQVGGFMVDNGRQLSASDPMRKFKAGDEAVLFVTHWQAEDALEVNFGPSGAFWVDQADQSVAVPATFKTTQDQELRGKPTIPLATFQQTLRALAGRR